MLLELNFLVSTCVSVFMTIIFLTCCLIYVDWTGHSLCYPWFVPLVLWFGFFGFKMARDFEKSRKHDSAKKIEQVGYTHVGRILVGRVGGRGRGGNTTGRGGRGVSPTTRTEEEPPTWV